MRIEELAVANFRNLKEQTVRFTERVTLIVGANGQGKTSLLEAAFFLAHAKSFRTSHQSELVRWRMPEESQIAAIARGKIASSVGTTEIACEIFPRSKRALINGKPIEQASLFYGKFVVVVFTPDELQLVKGAAAVRRKFIDRILVMSDSRYVATAVQYQRALKQRNAQLTALRAEGGSGSFSSLTPWNMLLAKHGIALTERRAQLVAELQPLAQKYYQELVQGSSYQESIELAYVSPFVDETGVRTEAEAFQLLEAANQNDLRRSTTSLGPHRDDVDLRIDVGSGFHPARYTASQGQARSMSLAIVLAAVEQLKLTIGEPPVVLLDDVESEFDRSRKLALHAMLSRLQSQVIITATEPSEELLAYTEQVQILTLAGGYAEFAPRLD